AVVSNKRDAAAVRRAVRLVIGAAIVSQLLGDGIIGALPPQTPLHRVDERRAVRSPRGGRGAARELRQIQFAIVIVVRQRDLAEHGSTRRSGLRAQRSGGGNDRRDDTLLHAT